MSKPMTVSRRSGRLRFWRSPPDQPRWARPALLTVTALAAMGYAWGIGNLTLEPFYGAAARATSACTPKGRGQRAKRTDQHARRG